MIYLEKIDDDDSKSHEFIHLLQDNNYFYYIREASAEIISNEYYGSSVDSYQEEVKRVKVLMEIIGSNPIWNVNFSGSEEKLQEFTDILYNNLSFDEYDKIIDILTTSPGYKTDEEMKTINEEFDRILASLYRNIYQEPIENNEIIQYLYNTGSNEYDQSRHYFQDRENTEGRITEISEVRPVMEAIQEENIEIDFYKVTNIEISEEEYYKRKSSGEEVYCNIKDLAEGVSVELVPPTETEGHYYLVNGTIKVRTEEELVELRYAIPENFYRKEKEPVPVEEIGERWQRGEYITEEIKKSPTEYTYTGIVYTTENEVATPMLVITKKVDWEPVKENIIDTKNQIRVPHSK